MLLLICLIQPDGYMLRLRQKEGTYTFKIKYHLVVHQSRINLSWHWLLHNFCSMALKKKKEQPYNKGIL